MTKTEALQKARSYLIENVGNMVGPGEAYYDQEEEAWYVEIFYEDWTQSFKIGELQVGPQTQRVHAPPTRELLTNLERQQMQGMTVILQIASPDTRTRELLQQLAAGHEVQML